MIFNVEPPIPKWSSLHGLTHRN